MNEVNRGSEYGTPKIGCYLEHVNYSDNQLSVAIVEGAIERGFQTDADAKEILARWDVGQHTEDDAEALHELSEEAINWLNEQETRTGLCWGNDGEAGAFGLWVDVESAKESVGFVSVKSHGAAKMLGIETDPTDSAFPPETFRGEWLHINDHGNCTLYVRESRTDQGAEYGDRQIWSVV